MPNIAKAHGKNDIKRKIDTLLHAEGVKLLAWLCIDNDVKHQEVLDVLRYLMMNTEDSPDNPYNPFIEFLSIAIENYEKQKYVFPKSDPIAILKSLMADHNLKQSDLPEIGNQAKVSEILSGKRTLNKRQIEALCQRFHLSPVLFLASTSK